MKIELNLDEAGIKESISEAVLHALDANQREGLIQAAIAYLLSPDDLYGRKQESPLQRAFQQALINVAREVVRQGLEADPEIRVRFEALFQEAMHRFFETNREKTLERIVNALTESFGDR
jgi:hypothetical protein